VPARVEQWHGWVFANVTGDAPPLAEQLGNAGMVVDGYEAPALVLGARHEYEVAANWKVIVENYLECYHCAPIHPELCEVTPAGVGHRLPGGAGRQLGRRPAGAAGRRADHVAGRPQPRRADPGPAGHQDPRGRLRGAAADAADQPAPGLTS
jgi:Rieske 2Fe-2S family protein